MKKESGEIAKYCLIKEDYNYIHNYETHIDIGEFNSFKSGKRLNLDITEPFLCDVDCTPEKPPCHYIATAVAPIFSGVMIDQFRLAGIENFQIFPVKLVNKQGNYIWDNYFALNALEVIDAADMEKSEYKTIMGGNMEGDGIPPLLGFEKLIIDPAKANGVLMFREICSPSTLVFDYKVVDYLRANRPQEGWRIKIKKL